MIKEKGSCHNNEVYCRCLPNTRRKLNGVVLRSLITQIYPPSEREALLAFVEEATGEIDASQTRTRSATKSPVPEVDAYINLLILVRLIDTNRLEESSRCSQALMNKITSQNRRTIDHIAAKCYFYHSRVAELTNRYNMLTNIHTHVFVIIVFFLDWIQ